MNGIKGAMITKASALAGAGLALVLAAVMATTAPMHHGAKASGPKTAVGVDIHAVLVSNPTYVFYITGTMTGLYPGANLQLPLTVTNPNTDPIQVNSINVALGTVTGGTGPGTCGLSDIHLNNYSGPGFVVPKNNGTRTVNVPISMPNSAGNHCETATFNLTYSGSGVQAIIESNTTCSATNPPPGYVVSGNLTVPSGVVCTLDGVDVQGNVTVNSGGSLIGLHAINIKGNLQATGAPKITLDQGTTVGGNLQLTSTGGIRVIGAIDGNIQISGTTGTSAGSPNYICASTSKGNLQLDTSAAAAPFNIGGMPSPCSAGDVFGGNAQLTNNVGALTFANNQVGNQLQCSGNTAINASHNTAKQKQGQCAGTS